MADSDDFGGFGITTPVASRKGQLNSAVAGPSRSRTNTKRKATAHVSVDSEEDGVEEVKLGKSIKLRSATVTAKRRRQEEDVEDVETEGEERMRRSRQNEVEVDEGESEGEGEVQEIVPPTKSKKPRGASGKPTARSGPGREVLTNGNMKDPTAVKWKGRAKPSSSSMVKRKDNTMDVDEMEVVEIEREDVHVEVDKLTKAVHAASRDKQALRLEKLENDEIVRLREQLQRAQKHINDLKQQLEELHQVRQTEPELLLQRTEAQHQAERQAHEALIHDLQQQLSRKDPLLRTTKNAVFELLTREEADKETQALRDQVNLYKEAVRERDQRIKQKDGENEELRRAQNELRYELNMEIERSKELLEKASQKPPDSVPRSRGGRVIGQGEDPKMAEVVRFYEDLTNLLVTDVKPQPALYLHFEDWLLTCVYSYRDVVSKIVPSKSLSFKLRLSCEPVPDLQGEPKSKADLIQSLQYTPLHLEKEAEDFVESLGFLNKPFSFEREQLALFLRTLHDVVGGEGKGDEDDGEDVEVLG